MFPPLVQHVKEALEASEERVCWADIISSAESNEAALALVKVLERHESAGQYQSKHLSFQEYLAAAEAAHPHFGQEAPWESQAGNAGEW